LLNASLGVLPVTTHVPLSNCAVGARNGIGTAYYTHNEVAGFEATKWVGLNHATKRLVAKYKARLTRRRPTIFTLDDFDVGTADANSDRFYQH
jgi:hypothetical protein